MRLTETYPPRAIAILPRGPAGMCGLIEIGDVLVKIEGHDVTCKDITLIRSMIAGQEGTMVSLEFQREVSDGSTRELAVNLRRAMLDLSLEASLESPQGLAVSAVSPVVRSPSRSPMQQGVREILGSILDSFTDETWNVEAALDESTHLLISQFGEDDIISEFKTLEERARSPHPEAVFATAEPSVFFFPVFPVSYPEARPQLPSVVTWSIVPLEPMALQLDLDVLGHADVSTVIMPGMPDAVSEDADEPTIVIDVAEVEDAFHSIAIGSFVPLSSLRGSLPPASPCFNVKLENAALSEEVAARAQERLFWEEEHIQSQEKFEQKVQEYAKEIARLKQRLKDADLELEDSKNIILQLEEKINLSQFEVAAIESEFSSLQQQPAPNLQGADDGIVEDREQYAEHESPVETLHHLQARMSTIVKMIASAALAASSVHKVLKSSEPTEAAQKVNIDTLQADEFQEALTASKTVLAQLAATQEKVKDLEAQLKQVMDELDQLRQEKEAALDSVHQVVLLMVQRDLEAQQRKDLEMQLKSVQDELAQFKRDTDQAGQSLTSLSSQPITPRSKTPDSSQSSAKSRAQLPPGWKEYWSKSKHKPFYKLKETGATFWTLPDHVLKQIVHSSADSPAAMAESKPLVEETATPRDDAYAVTLYRCEFNCGFNSKSFDEMAAHKKEGSCKVKSEQKATVSWGCEHGCDFKGSFEQVLEHEAICDLNPQVMRSAENVGENKIDRENLMAEQAKKLAEKEEQVKKLTEKGELTEKELLILQTELELCNERLEATETELDAFKKSGAETDLVMMNEIATEKSILEVQLNLTLEEVVNLQLQHESSAEDLEAAALLTEKLGLEIRVIADELAQLKLASGGAAVMDSSPSIAIVSLQSSPDKKGPDYTDMPVAVALTLDCDFDDKIRDSETRCTFNDALMSDLSAILDLPKSSLMVVGHQRGSVIAEVVLSGAADDSVGKGLPGYADDRNPAQLAQQLVDAVQGGDRGLRTLPLGQFMSKAEIHGPVAEPVFRALKKAIETAHELALDEFNRTKLFGFQTPTKEILIASPGLQIDVPETPASPQGTQTLHAHTDAGTDAIPTSPLSPRGTQTDGFEEGVARATQMSSPTQANSTQVCLESVVTSTQTMANKMADTGTDAVPQPPQTPRGTQTKVTMTAEAGTGTIEALRSPCGTQTLSPTNTAASIQVMPDVVTVKTQAMPDVAEAEAQTLPEESGIAVQATARTTCEAVQATAEVSDMGVSTDESVASIGKLAVQGLTQVMNAKWILQLSRCCDKSSVQRAFDGWRQEMSDVNALEKKLAWKMSYFNNYLTRPAFRKWCLEMITTYVVRQKVQSADVKHETQLLKDIFAMWSHSANAKFLRECKGTRVHEKVWSRPMSLAFIHWHHLTYWGVSVHRTAARRAHRRAAACLQEWRCKVKKLKGRSSKLSLRELRRRRFVRAKYLHLWEYQTIRMRLRKRSRVACERLHRRTQLFGIFVQWTLHTSRSVRMMLEQNQQKPMLLVHVCPSKRSVLLHAIDRWIFGVTHHLQRAGKVSKASRKRIMMCQTRGFKVWKAMTLRHREAVLQGSKLLDNHIIGVLAANLERFKENRRRCQTLQLWLKAQKMGTLGSALDRWLLAVCKALPEYETVLSDVQNPDKVSDALKPVVLAKQVRNPASDESDVGEAPIRLNFNKAQHLPSTDAKEQSPDSFVEKKKEFSASPISEKSLSPSQSHGHGRLTLWESGTNAQQRRAITQNVNESSDDSFLEGRSNAVATSRVFSSSDDDDLPSPQEQHVRSWGKKWKVNGLNDMHASTSSSPAPERTRVSFSPRSRWTTPQALNSGAKANVSCAKANVRASQSPTSRNTFPGLRISGGSLGDLRSRPLPPARSKTKSDGEHASLNDGNPPHNTSLQSSQHASPKDAAGTPKNLKMLRKKLRMYD